MLSTLGACDYINDQFDPIDRGSKASVYACNIPANNPYGFHDGLCAVKYFNDYAVKQASDLQPLNIIMKGSQTFIPGFRNRYSELRGSRGSTMHDPASPMGRNNATSVT
ncbi:DNA polymerase III alpha [Striga asiatica]|uniref:DNA polymerase III alpha n=1 Tax=Striga asiatica TaxID=4170 RepID=A0A5A7PJD0_STRAF|nr:DNA polymerase III alpha [Striga asiatica]